MLLVQDITLSWDKAERNSICAKKRAEFPMVYSLDNFPDTVHGDAIVHRLFFWMRGTVFQPSHMKNIYHIQGYPSVKDLNLSNLHIQQDVESYEVTFFYDEHRSGLPIRRGHNKDYHNINSSLYCKDILNETIFCLKVEQYGRVIWNERKIDYDTGEWYYRLNIINLLHYVGKQPEPNIFLTNRPDFVYRQMAVLY